MTQKCNWDTCTAETVPERTDLPLIISSSWKNRFFFFSKLLSSRKQYASITDNIPHFWESSGGPFFPLSPAQSFVLQTPNYNEVTLSKHGGIPWVLETLMLCLRMIRHSEGKFKLHIDVYITGMICMLQASRLCI